MSSISLVIISHLQLIIELISVFNVYSIRKSASTLSKQNLNENFVKLELKKKRYTRKGLFHIKGEAYKRQVWKQMMQRQEGGLGLGNRGKRGGWRGGRGRGRGRGSMNMANPADKCFKCGQTGHWASTCYGNINTHLPCPFIFI